MQWSSGQRISEETHARLLADPRLPTATRMLAVKMLDAAKRDPALDGTFKDTGRYVAATLVVYLHGLDELTLPKLKAYCAESGLLSPGRARALLSYLRYLNFIAVLPADMRRGAARYVPTEALLKAWRDHLRAALEAACILEPAAMLVAAGLDDPAVFNSFVRLHTEELMAMAPFDPKLDTAFLRIIMHRFAGTQIIWAMLAAGGDVFPPDQPIALSVAATAQRFRVSRIHVQRMLDDAQREGLIGRTADGGVILEEKARAFMRFLYPIQLIRLLSAAAKTLEAHPELISGHAD
jgi:hypothetical protein